MSTLRRGREEGLDKPRVRQGVEKLHRGVAKLTTWKFLCFCFVLFFFFVASRTCLLD